LVRANSKAAGKDDDNNDNNINSTILKLAFRGKIHSDEIPQDIFLTLVSEGLASEKGEHLFPTDKGRKYAESLRGLANLS